MASRPRTASCRRPGPTSSPTSRSTRPKVTTCDSSGSDGTALPRAARRRDEIGERLVPDRLDVLAVLEHRAERLLDHLGVDLLPTQGGQRMRPVDRLRHTRRLREIEATQTADECGRLGGEALWDARDAEL